MSQFLCRHRLISQLQNEASKRQTAQWFGITLLILQWLRMVWHYSTYIDRITSGATLLLQLRKQRKYRNNHSILDHCDIARTDIARTAVGINRMACRSGSPQSPPRNSSNGLSVGFSLGEFSDHRMWHILCILFGSSCSRLFRFLGSRRSAPRSLSVSTLRSCSSSNESLS